MNELIREQDPIEQDIIAPDHQPKGDAIRGLAIALPLALAIWGVVLGSLWLYFKRG